MDCASFATHNPCVSYFRIVINALPWIKARGWFSKNEPSSYVLFLEILHLIPPQLNIDCLHPNKPQVCLQLSLESTRGMIRRGCASVLNTHWSRGITDDGEKRRYKYLRVSAKKKLCIMSSFCPELTCTAK